MISNPSPKRTRVAPAVVIVLTAVAAVALGVGTFSVARQNPRQAARAGTAATSTRPAVPATPTPRYDYTLDLDLVDLRSPTAVRISVEDADGVRVVQERRRSPGERFEIKTRARGDRATIRIYYGGKLVKTIVQHSDGKAEESSSGDAR